MSFEISNLAPVPYEDARGIVALTNEDLRHSGLSEEIISTNADPANQKHVDTQRRQLEEKPDQYRVLHDKGVIGVAKLAEWYTGDQWPYASLIERVNLIKRARRNEHHLEGSPLGIFSLLVAQDPEYDQAAIAKILLDDMLKTEAMPEVRIGIHPNDRIKDMLIDEYGFEPTGKHGKILGSPVTQELHIRKPQN